MNGFRDTSKVLKLRKRYVIAGMSLSFLVGAVSFPVANAATQYVTIQQRNKDLTDVAKQMVALQRRISNLEFCIRNLRVSKYSSFGNVEC